MQLKTIFAKPIDRTIEGVIKADDESGLRVEIDEYVLTNEIERRLESFLESYNNYEGANGVWISGFFGCGKSHLLKMLSLLLENRKIDGGSVADAFEQKCGDNAMLKGSMKKAVAIPSQSILFNIDQKADVIDKSQADALLKVFVKVFNEACGYCAKHGYIAEFERKLDEDGLFEKFKQAFTEQESRGWEWGRDRVVRMQPEIDVAYEAATGTKQEKVIDRYKADYKLSIEDFADMVGNYIDRQSDKTFRLNFFVDEVGQYIADNTKLMTNLQSVAESLATRCKGRAWVIVTAQEDMDTIVGAMSKQQSNDFSRIKARFAIPMKLTSQDVAEVIERRLLEKNEESTPKIVALYEKEQNNLATLFNFTDGQTYRNFRDQAHFIDCYPFIPYQFELLQLAIRDLSRQNAFEGKHSSVGARSMLAVFQDVAEQLADKELGELASFDLMFAGIQAALKSEIQSSIHRAAKHLDNPFAVQVLKALFLVKYIEEFKPTLRNIRVLMQSHFQCDLPALDRDLETALNLLERETYIRRHGELYNFLNDKEKQVEQNIKNIEIDNQDIMDELHKIIFDQVIKNNKIRYEPIKHDYSFTRKLDDRMFGRERELAIHVVTPFHNEYENLDSVKMQAMGRYELLVVLPANDRLIQDLLRYLQTKKYVSQAHGGKQDDLLKRVLQDKTHANQERHANLVEEARDAIVEADLFVANQEVESGSKDAQARINEGFENLVTHVYTNLKMLRGVSYSDTQIESFVQGNDTDLFGGTELSEAESEMLNHIQRNKSKGMATSIKTLVEAFEQRPYGWPLAAIQCVLAKLCGRHKVDATSDSESLEGGKLTESIKKTQRHGNVLLEPQTVYAPSQIRKVKDFINNFFDVPAKSNEPKTLGAECADRFKDLHEILNDFHLQKKVYPFVGVLAEPVRQCKEYSAKTFKFFFDDFSHDVVDGLHAVKDETLDPMCEFMSKSIGRSGAEIYTEATTFLAEQGANLKALAEPIVSDLRTILDDPRVFASQRFSEVGGLLEELEKVIEEQRKIAREEALARVAELKRRVEGEGDYAKLTAKQKAEVEAAFAAVTSQIEADKLVANIHHHVKTFEEQAYGELLDKIHERANPPIDDDDEDETGDDEVDPPVKREKVQLKEIKSGYDKAKLDNESDVGEYVAALKEAMLEEIESGKWIQL